MAALLLLPGFLAGQTKDSGPERTEVTALIFRGVNAVDKREIAASIATSASHCIGAILTPLCWISKANYLYTRKYLDREELARDILRARVFYWKRGYREAEVDTLVTKRGEDKVAVTFLIDENSPTMVSDITVTQKKPVLSNREIASRVVLGKNSPLNLIRLDSSLIFLQQKLWDKGYANAIVDTTVAIDTASKTATVAIDLDPRSIATVSDIIVEGNEKIETGTILKSLTLQPGKIFRRSELLRSQRALYESNLFRRAAIDVPRQGDSSKVVVVTVQESPLRDARVSAGFNTVDFVQVDGRFTHYDLWGDARQLDAQLTVGNLLANTLNGRLIFRDAFRDVRGDRDRYFAPTYNASVNFRQPWFLAHDNDLGLSVFAHRRSSPGIFVDRGYGASATFTRYVLERAPLSANYTFQISQVSAGDIYFCINFGVCDRPTLDALRENQRLSPFALVANINRSNDPFSPTRGYRATASLEHASAFSLSSFRYNRAAADVAVYRPVRKRGALAGHLRLGWVRALESTGRAVGAPTDAHLLHPGKRFYAGGARSVRGFGENQLGPRVLTIPSSKLRAKDPGCTEGIDITTCDPNVEDLARVDFEPRPLGGNVVAELSAEFRFPLWRELFGAGFLDYGYVAQRTNPELPRSRSAVTPGFGVRYRSPVGPIRVDIGINPGREESLPVVTEAIVDGENRLVTLAERRRFAQSGGGSKGVLQRMTLHLSIGEAF